MTIRLQGLFLLVWATVGCSGMFGERSSKGGLADALTKAAKRGPTPVVNWPPEVRKKVEDLVESGEVPGFVLTADNTVEKVVPGCFVPGSAYRYRGQSVHHQRINVSRQHSEGIDLPVGMAQLGLEDKGGHQARFELFVAGTYLKSGLPSFSSEAGPECRFVTHFASAVEYGAYEMASNSRRTTGDGVGLGRVSANEANESGSDESERDGDPRKCELAKKSDSKAPDGCDSVVTITITSLRPAAKRKAQPVAPARKVELDYTPAPEETYTEAVQESLPPAEYTPADSPPADGSTDESDDSGSDDSGGDDLQ